MMYTVLYIFILYKKSFELVWEYILRQSVADTSFSNVRAWFLINLKF